MNKPLYVITGATGNVGSKLAERLLARGVRVRVVGRDEVRLKRFAARGAEPSAGDIGDRAFLERSFTGAEGVFAMIPPRYEVSDFRAYQNQVSESLTEAARNSGVRKVVNLSSIGAHLPEGTGPIAGLHDHEQRMNKLSGIAVLNLRPAFFMENHLWNIPLIKAQGINGGSMRPDIAVSQIATADIAERAAQRLLEMNFAGSRVEELLGAADLNQAESTKILGAAIGRPDLAYVQFPYEGTLDALLKMGMSRNAAETMVEMYRSFNDGVLRSAEPRTSSNTTRTTLEEFARTVFAPAYAAS
ncbi:MAG: NAD(P)H-binding protein [Acidobacteriota bacterium]